MNYITRLQNNAQITREWVADLRSHLGSPKFQGTEAVCSECGSHIFNDYGQCVTVGCEGTMRHERKDWISTGDVLRLLDNLEGSLIP